MPTPMICDCGWSGAVRDDSPRPRCPACHAPLVFPPLEPVEALGPVVHEASAEERVAQRRRATAPPGDEPFDGDDPDAEGERGKDERYRPGLILSPGTLTALGFLLIGGIWMAVDMSHDRIPFGPMILLTFGIIRLRRCLLGAEER
jgi:hypothetical protein